MLSKFHKMCCPINFYCLLLFALTYPFAWAFLICFGIALITERIDRIHGVHETYFSFDGLYKITTDHEHNQYRDLVFVTNCHAITPYGNCYYDCYDNNVYQLSADYGGQYCNNRTLYGFISTETHKCTLYNPNNDLYVLSMIVKCSLAYVVIGILCIYLVSKYNESANYGNIQQNNYTNVQRNIKNPAKQTKYIIEKENAEKIKLYY